MPTNCTVSSTVTRVLRKKHSAVPLQTTVQPVDMPDAVTGAPKTLHPCNKCDKQYAQPQGLTRHEREAHEISWCLICDDFRWSRRYQLTKHLKEQHPDVDIGATLYEATRRRREATMNKKYLRQQQASPPAIERNRRSHGKPLPRSSSPVHILPAVAKVSHVSLPTTLSMANNPLPEHREKRVTSCKREDARGLDLFDSTNTNAPSVSSSTEERPQSVNDADVSVQHGQIWLVYPFLVGT